MWIWSKQTQPLCFELFFRNPLLERKPSEDLSCLKKEGRALILFVILMCNKTAFVWGWIFKTVWLLMEWKHFIAKTYQKMLEHCLQQGPNSSVLFIREKLCCIWRSDFILLYNEIFYFQNLARIAFTSWTLHLYF